MPMGSNLSKRSGLFCFLLGVRSPRGPRAFSKEDGFWQRILYYATPPVRLRLSGRNSGKFGKTPKTLSELSLEFPSRVRLGSPKPYNSRHLKAPERFQNCLPPSTAGDASFFESGSGEGLSEPVMEFPAVLGYF